MKQTQKKDNESEDIGHSGWAKKIKRTVIGQVRGSYPQRRDQIS